MTVRKNKFDPHLITMGKIIKKKRENLGLSKSSREFFIEDRILTGLLNEHEISLKTLSNIENGVNMPNLSTLKSLSVALEVDFLQLIKEIEPYIPTRRTGNDA